VKLHSIIYGSYKNVPVPTCCWKFYYVNYTLARVWRPA